MASTDSPTDSVQKPRPAFLALAPLALGLLAAACAPEMDPASLIERTRVLGARVEVEGDPGRASPRPGETATVTWLVTAPAEMPSLGWAFVVCPASASSLFCQGDPLAVFQGTQGPPVVTFTVPEAAALGTATELRLLGRICVASMPTFDGPDGLPTCSDAGDGTTAALAMTLDPGEGDGNRNPNLRESPVLLDGMPWATAQVETCGSLPAVPADEVERRISLGTAPADRERYVGLAGDPAQPMDKREWLQISQFTTAGELERGFSTVEGEASDDAGTVEVGWTPPPAAEVPDTGLVVRFTFVARDPRGGSDWITRALCVTR